MSVNRLYSFEAWSSHEDHPRPEDRETVTVRAASLAKATFRARMIYADFYPEVEEDDIELWLVEAKFTAS